MNYLLSFFLLLILIYQTKSQEPYVECYEEDSYCSISNVKSTKGLKKLFDVATEEPLLPPETIKQLRIGISKITTLTPDVCKDFHNLEVIDVENIRLFDVDKDAFVHCKKLKKINLAKNGIKKFHKKTFNRNPKLMEINLSSNNLGQLDENLFSKLKNLTELSIQDTKIIYLDPKMFRDLISLKILNLRHNFLVDLEIEKMLKYLVNLKEIYLADNNFNCGRVKGLLEILRNNGVMVNDQLMRSWGCNKFDEKIKGIQCLNEQNFIRRLKIDLRGMKKNFHLTIFDVLIEKKPTYDYFGELIKIVEEDYKKMFGQDHDKYWIDIRKVKLPNQTTG